jgi:hypothetical protein
LNPRNHCIVPDALRIEKFETPVHRNYLQQNLHLV